MTYFELALRFTWCGLILYLLWDLTTHDLPALRQAWRELQAFKREKE